MNISFKIVCVCINALNIEIMFLLQVQADISVDNNSVWFNSVHWSKFHKMAVPIKHKYRR
jgi:hypothetical protein